MNPNLRYYNSSVHIEKDPEEDRIIYLMVSKGGGVDGKDHTDKGGAIRKASFTNNLTPDPWSVIEKRVIELNSAKKAALSKLNEIDKLVLGL